MFIPDHYKRLKRGPQVILPKDIGLILAYSGVGKDSVCIDAGTGSGWLAVSLARVCREVHSYDIRDEFIKIAERNKASEKLENLLIEKRDVTKGFGSIKDADLVVLDMPDSHKAVRWARKSLKSNGFICGYLPHTEQVKEFIKALSRSKFRNINTMEAIVRDMLVREQGTRPSTKGVWHTAYLVFAQK